MGGGGWGAGPWGANQWGAGAVVDLELLDARAVRENVVRLFFNVAPLFTYTDDPHDAASPLRYSVTPVAGTSGLDGEPTRNVNVVRADLALVPLSFGTEIDVTVDRPFSPWDSRYIVAVNQLVTSSGALLAPGATSREFPGLYRILRVPNVDAATPSRDVANPQTYQDQLDPLPQAGDPAALGVYPVGSDGDYAFDEGIANLRKRIFRRLITRPGAFIHLPTYGVGVPLYGKRLGTTAVRQQIAAAAEQQIGLEPDVLSVKVTLSTSPTEPSLTILRAQVQTTRGPSVDMQVPFSTV
jgi:hypothetical protein